MFALAKFCLNVPKKRLVPSFRYKESFHTERWVLEISLFSQPVLSICVIRHSSYQSNRGPL